MMRVPSLMRQAEVVLVAGAGHDVVAAETELLRERILAFL